LTKSDRTRPTVVAAVPTPFTIRGEVDLEAATELFSAVAASGVDGMFVAGSTGEFPALSMEERKTLTELALDSSGTILVFPHVGAASSWEASRLAAHAVEAGAEQMAAVTPYYWASADPELEAYFAAVAAAADGKKVYGYSIPAVAQNRISGDLLRRLKNLPNFAGVKVSIPSVDAIRELVKASDEHTSIYVGDDATAFEGLRAGAHGLVTGPGSAIPGPYIALAEAMAIQDTEKAERAKALIDMVVEHIRGNIRLIKLALDLQGLPGGATRAALPEPSTEDRRRLERLIEHVSDAVGTPQAARERDNAVLKGSEPIEVTASAARHPEPPPQARTPTGAIAKEFVFETDERFIECHGSTLLELPGGTTLVSWFAGTHEGTEDTAIWLSRRDASGWTQPLEVADEGPVPHWNPILHASEDGVVHLYYKIGKSIPSWRARVIYSEDGGSSWTEPRDLVPGSEIIRGPVKNKVIVLTDGSWLAPSSVESERWDAWDSFVDISVDQGRTWEATDFVPLDHGTFKGKGVIQPTLWESSPGNVHMLLRSTCGRVCRSDSQDYGRTWAPVYQTNLPNNNSALDLVRLSSGELVLVYNPVEGDWGPRTPLVVGVSRDNGDSWQTVATLEDEELPVDYRGLTPRATGILADTRAEFSYPAVIASGSGVAITYSYKRDRIAFVSMSQL
jgi:dihydrodipicolinate synthase/N-acetylneuraminate lyase/predicted neuraminidase